MHHAVVRPALWLVILGSFVASGCAVVTDRALFADFVVAGDDDDTPGDDDSAGDDDSGADDDDSVPLCDVVFLVDDGTPTTWTADVQPLLEERCATCHTDNELGGMSVAGNQGYDNVVNVPNSLGYGAPMPRITPFDATQSYLFHKVLRCDADDPTWGYMGGPMPPQLPNIDPLSQDDLLLLYRWIQQGAVRP